MPKLVAVLLVLAPVLVFWPVGGYAFLDWDDAAHILNNPHLLDLPYIWTHPLAGMYMPMTFTTWSVLMGYSVRTRRHSILPTSVFISPAPCSCIGYYCAC